MSYTDDHIKRLNEKLQLLLKRYQDLEKDNRKLKQALQQRAEEEKSLQEKITVLQEQAEIFKATASDSGDVQKNELEKRINSYIREIDQCIAILSSH